MIPRRRFPGFALVCMVVLASFTFALVKAYEAHTDDGCQVELHCFACHWAFASAAVVAPPASLPVSLDAAGAIAPAKAPAPPGLEAASAASRGPPPA